MKNQVVFEFLKGLKNLEDLNKVLNSDYNVDLKKNILECLQDTTCLKYAPFEYASERFIRDRAINTSIFYSGISTGGRVVNERPHQILIHKAVDVDIASAYGSALRKLGLPIGRPRYLGYSSNQSEKCTIRQFFKKHGDDLKKNGLYKLVVSGKLSFSQDFIFSRVIPKTVRDNVFNKTKHPDLDVDQPNYPNVLIRNELCEATITKEIWEVIVKVATALELKEILDLEISSAIFYLDSDEEPGLKEYAESSLLDPGSLEFSEKAQNLTDTRHHKYYYLKFEGIIGKLVDRRLALKKRPECLAESNALKLFINTFYGIFCSYFFKVNNIVVADRITATIRAACWLLSKPLNLKQTITDGGFAELNNLFQFKKKGTLKKPGLDVLSSEQNMLDYRYIEKTSLNEINWDKAFEDKNSMFVNNKYITSSVESHVKLFWSRYNIDIPFSLEIKNILYKGAYLQKAHYYFKLFNDKTMEVEKEDYYKIRGFRYSEELKYLHPSYLLLKHICDNSEKPELLKEKFFVDNNGEYETGMILRIPTWLQSLDADKKSCIGDGLMPGDYYITTLFWRLNNMNFPIDTLKTFNRRDSRGRRSMKNSDGTTSKPQLFEKYLYNHSIGEYLLKSELDVL